MALPTQFSVTTGKVSPIANPKAPTDLPKKLEAEEVNIASGASLIPSLSATDTDSPDQLSAQDKASTPAPVTLTPNAGTPTTPPFALNHARILYRNLLESFTSVTPSSGTTASSVVIPNTYERWNFTATGSDSITITIPANEDIDTICIGAHNLDGATIEFSYDNDASGGFTSIGTKTGGEFDIMLHLSSTVSARRIQISISGLSGARFIGYISAGVALQMQRPFFNGHTPITDSDVTEYYSNRSESGEIIGQQIRRKGYETQAQWNNIDDGWYRSYFAPFKQYVKTRPFFFAWNLLEYPDDVGFCRINQDIRSPIQNGSTTKRTVNMTLLGAG